MVGLVVGWLLVESKLHLTNESLFVDEQHSDILVLLNFGEVLDFSDLNSFEVYKVLICFPHMVDI